MRNSQTLYNSEIDEVISKGDIVVDMPGGVRVGEAIVIEEPAAASNPTEMQDKPVGEPVRGADESLDSYTTLADVLERYVRINQDSFN